MPNIEVRQIDRHDKLCLPSNFARLRQIDVRMTNGQAKCSGREAKARDYLSVLMEFKSMTCRKIMKCLYQGLDMPLSNAFLAYSIDVPLPVPSSGMPADPHGDLLVCRYKKPDNKINSVFERKFVSPEPCKHPDVFHFQIIFRPQRM